MQFSLLLDQGLDTKTMIELCFKQSDKIINQLNQGKNLIDVLTANQKQKYFKLLNELSKKMAFSKSIECASHIDESISTLSKDLISKSIYPVFIFLFAYFMILFFSNTIIPSMTSFSDGETSFFILDFFKIFYSFVFIGLVFLAIVLISSHFNEAINVRLLLILDKYEFFKLFKTIHFSIILSYLLKSGVSTKECLELMSNMKEYYSVNVYASKILDGLLKGRSIDQTVEKISFDTAFKKFFYIGLKTGNLADVLLLYKKQSIHRFKKKVKQLTTSIQVFSYVSVGMLVLVVYQVMLVPLNMLNGM